MDTLIHADVFFFITTIAVIVVALLVAAGLFYVVRILRNVRRISDLARGAAESLSGDLAAWRDDVHGQGSPFTWLFRMIAGAIRGDKGRTKRTSNK